MWARKLTMPHIWRRTSVRHRQMLASGDSTRHIWVRCDCPGLIHEGYVPRTLNSVESGIGHELSGCFTSGGRENLVTFSPNDQGLMPYLTKLFRRHCRYRCSHCLPEYFPSTWLLHHLERIRPEIRVYILQLGYQVASIIAIGCC